MSDLKDTLEREAESRSSSCATSCACSSTSARRKSEKRWEQVEDRWHKLEGYLGRLKSEGAEALDDVGDAAELLVDEIKQAFANLRKIR